MFFINEQHQTNFEEFCFLNTTRKRNPEYRTAYYILSVPELYRFQKRKDAAPLEWTRNWSDDETTYEMSEAYKVLSHSERMLVELAQNLFNGGGNFDLMEAISVCGDDYKRIMLDAVKIRDGKL